MRRRERIIVQVTVRDRCVQQFGERDGLRRAARQDHATARDDDGKLRLCEQCGRLVECGRVTGPAADPHRRADRSLDIAVEVVARDIELRRPHLEHRAVEAARGDLGHALRVVHVPLVLGDLREDRQLLGLLEAAEAHRHRARLGRDEHDRRVRPVGGRDCRDEIGDARPVLCDADAMATRRARIAVRHVRGALLVRHRNEANARRREDVEGIHIGGADDAEDLCYPVGGQGLDEGFGRCHALQRGSGHSRSPLNCNKIVFRAVASIRGCRNGRGRRGPLL